MKIIEYSIKNRVVIVFATLVLTIAGIFSYFELGKLEDPEFKVKEAIVVTLYPGASPKSVEQEVTDKIEIDSAATSSWEHGNPVHYGTRDKLLEVGISVEGMYSRILKDSDLEADYIVGMDNSNIENIIRFVDGRPTGEIKKLLEYANEDRIIDDPWYTGDFEKTYKDVVKGCEALLEKIKKEHL